MYLLVGKIQQKGKESGGGREERISARSRDSASQTAAGRQCLSTVAGEVDMAGVERGRVKDGSLLVGGLHCAEFVETDPGVQGRRGQGLEAPGKYKGVISSRSVVVLLA